MTAHQDDGAVALRFLLVVIMLAVGALTNLAESFGDEIVGNSETIVLPSGLANPAAVEIEVTIPNDAQPAYVPIRIALASIGAFTADRSFVVQLQPVFRQQTPPENRIAISIPLKGLQGQTETIVTRLVPKWTLGIGYKLEVFEDGRPLPGFEYEFSNPKSDSLSANNLLQREIEFVELVVVDNASRESNGDIALPSFSPGQEEGTVTLLRAVDQLPDDWRSYQYVDAVIANFDVLEKLRDLGGTRYDALRRWVLCGGTVVGLQSPGKNLVCEVLGFGWRELPNDIGYPFRSRLLADGRIDRQSIGGGYVFSIGTPNTLDHQQIQRVLDYRRSVTLRRGVDPLLGDARFRRWVIPGVAQPPVYTFIGLLTCFVILVGPVAYRRTTKLGRAYLMFAIAPVLALITTVAMFAYGVISDGFGVKVRVRQLTFVDGQSGDAAERVRATYFAGIRPAMGPVFPSDAEVFGYPPGHNMLIDNPTNDNSRQLGRVIVSENAQQFGNTFIPSRAQTQFVYHVPKPGLGRLTLHERTSESEPAQMTIDSSLEFDLRQLIVRDAKGEYWTPEALPAGAKGIPCVPITDGDAGALLSDLFFDYEPVSDVVEPSFGPRRYYELRDVIRSLGAQVPDSTRTVGVVQGVFEEQLQYALQQEKAIPFSSFIGLSNISDDAVAIPDTRVVDSVRYVMGTLP